MTATPPLTPEQTALLQLIAAGASVVLLADIALLGVVFAGWTRGRSLLARRWSAAHVLIAGQVCLAVTILLVLFITVLVGAVLMLLRGADSGAESLAGTSAMRVVVTLSLVAQNAAMVAVVLFVVHAIYDQHPRAAGFSLRAWGPRAVLGLLAAVLLVPVSEVLERLSRLALEHVPLPQVATFLALVQRAIQQQYADLLGMFSGVGGLALAILLVGIIGPFGEEVFFRGFAYRCFRSRWGATTGIVASAALFSLVHVHPLGLLPIFVVGCALAYLYERTGTLVAPFTLHAANNIIAVVAVHLGYGK